MAMVNESWLVYRPEQKHQIPHALDCAKYQGARLETVELAEFIENAPAYLEKIPHVIALLESVDLGPLLYCAYQHGARVGLLPVHRMSKVCRLYGISATMEDAMPVALQGQGRSNLDLLLCNDEVVVWSVTLGDVPFFELRQIAYQQGLRWQHVKSIPAGVRELFHLQPKEVTLRTGKDTKIKTAVVGAMIIENDIESLVPHFAKETASNLDGKLSAVLVAPVSITDYLSFFLNVSSPSRVSKAIGLSSPRPSRAISYLKTERITLESASELEYYIDGQHRSAHHIEFRTIPKALSLNVGDTFLREQRASETAKDIVKVKTLPQGRERLTQMKKRLPLFSSAREEDFKEIFLILRDYVRPGLPFNLLMVLSAVLATLGLFLNNTPVVIGAMLLAPLMGPLVAFSMGMLRNDSKMLVNAGRVFAIGTALTILVAALTTLFVPYEQATDEIRARLQPNLLDLAVAIVSGMAAAYAHVRENVHKNLPGVAIAVALVPPACVMGIGLGWMEWSVVSGAGLLFLSNLIGIVLAGIFAFLVLGFAPVIKVNRGLGVSLLLALLVSVPLYQALKNTVVYQRIENNIANQSYQVNNKTVELSEISVSPFGDRIKITAELHSSEAVQADDIAALRDFIGKQLEENILLDVSLRLLQ